MKKIWQKSLASMVSAALCLTAFVGCLTVNAANYQGTITSAGTEITTAAAEAQIDLVVSANVPDGVKGMAYTGLKVTTGFGKLTNAKVTSGAAYVETKTTDGETPTPDIGADGQFIVAANDTSAGVKSFTVSLTFTKTVETLTAETTYPVNVDYLGTKADIGAANWDEQSFAFTTNVGKITVKSSHIHTWDAGVMTTMPTTTSDGVITYTCECGETKTEAFSVSGGAITEYPALTTVTVANIEVRYAAIINKQVFTGIASNGATVTNYGMLLTKDGSVPVAGEGTAVSLFEDSASNTSAAQGAQGYFRGMNFAQMGQTLTFRPYVKFTYNGEVCYYYGAAYSKVFIDAIRMNTDDRSAALVSLYDNKNSATNINAYCSGTQVATGNSSITSYAALTHLDLQGVRIQYAAVIGKTVFTGIGSNGGTVTNYGMLLTKDGSVPVAGEGTAVSLFEDSASNTSAAQGALGYFQGMNFKQMGQTLTFRPYVKYTDANGATAYEYGAAVSFVYIDALSSLAGDNAFATDLVNYYTTYVAQ